MDRTLLPRLTLDGTSIPLEISPEQLKTHYLPLAQYLIARTGSRRRVLAALAGPPAAGKSATAALLTAVINAISRSAFAVVVGMDGWHYPNTYLDTHTTWRSGEMVSLRQIKGAPETFDRSALHEFLQLTRTAGAVDFPVYSRLLHDPIPQAGKIVPETRLILIEGNYLLLDQPGWQELHWQFDIRMFVTAPREKLVAALRDRHLRGGKTPHQTDHHLAFSDLPNLELILNHSIAADIHIVKFDSIQIDHVIYPESG
jgi:hypothetical protein